MPSDATGKLILVPTPVGNLKDMTYRAVEVLQQADLILAEDTRVSGRLLKHFEIENQLASYHQNNEHKVLDNFIKKLLHGETLALVTDAGTPAVSDPGFLLVREALKYGLDVECLPGATSIIPALVVSGLPAYRFYMEAFLPHKKGRRKRLEVISQKEETVILMEAPYRILKTLDQLLEYCGEERQVCVCRELTKLHEEHVRGTLKHVVENFRQRTTIKGEIVIVLDSAG